MQLRKTDDERKAARQRREQEKAERSAERRRAAEEARQRAQALRNERAARRAATTNFPQLGVAVWDGHVYTSTLGPMIGLDDRSPIGKLAGAHAEVTGGRAGHRRSGVARAGDAALASTVVGPVGLLAGVSRSGTQGVAFVVFADGTLHEKKIMDQASLVRAQADAVRFNALAEAASPASQAEDQAPGAAGQDRNPDPPPQGSRAGRLIDELARLANLHSSGALTDDEFRAAKDLLLRANPPDDGSVSP